MAQHMHARTLRGQQRPRPPSSVDTVFALRRHARRLRERSRPHNRPPKDKSCLLKPVVPFDPRVLVLICRRRLRGSPHDISSNSSSMVVLLWGDGPRPGT
jgi:hypothetical protein